MQMKMLNLETKFPGFKGMTVPEVLAKVMPELVKEFPRLLEVQLHPVVGYCAYLRIGDEGDELVGAPYLILPDGAQRFSLAPREQLADLLGPKLQVVRGGMPPPPPRVNGGR